MIRYINVKNSSGTETVEELNSKDFGSLKEFQTTLAIRIGSYRMIYKSSTVSVSSRSTKVWSGN